MAKFGSDPLQTVWSLSGGRPDWTGLQMTGWVPRSKWYMHAHCHVRSATCSRNRKMTSGLMSLTLTLSVYINSHAGDEESSASTQWTVPSITAPFPHASLYPSTKEQTFTFCLSQINDIGIPDSISLVAMSVHRDRTRIRLVVITANLWKRLWLLGQVAVEQDS